MSLHLRSKYYYELPEELIAQYPLAERSESRLLYLNKATGEREHLKFADIVSLLHKGDVLVLNNTKVIPARLLGEKTTGAKVEVFLLHQMEDMVWECLVRPGRRLRDGAEVKFSEKLKATIVGYGDEGSRIVRFDAIGDFWAALDEIGKIPLPPYILRETEEKDKETYQTVYAEQKGSVAAPTAGLHFTDELLEKIKTKGVIITEVNLRVSLGTFRPVKTENIHDHVMHREFCEISSETADVINRAKIEKRRVIAVGTTSTRTMESFAVDGRVNSGGHWTDIFIYPGKQLQIIDGLITNFHMPESTLLMLVSAFAGYENIMTAYQEAVQLKYRFFSYGDAMVIL
ncbi:MAG: tRNA preQ1(34) S-adenosylmethionine ribosyltransferase-isomerase QueA [Candidatus Cloacimonetes bacterium]|nr:tRNA preQ1(34) S-adenosylmethionine ribosyltransferase-isomerase QueA [Candidatus Cloacimonadota bacterium]